MGGGEARRQLAWSGQNLIGSRSNEANIDWCRLLQERFNILD